MYSWQQAACICVPQKAQSAMQCLGTLPSEISLPADVLDDKRYSSKISISSGGGGRCMQHARPDIAVQVPYCVCMTRQ